MKHFYHVADPNGEYALRVRVQEPQTPIELVLTGAYGKIAISLSKEETIALIASLTKAVQTL